jgi:hypothetical protein
LPLWIARTPIAKRVGVKIQPDGEEMSLDLTVAELPETQVTVGNQIGESFFFIAKPRPGKRAKLCLRA